jgi:hypothetical protein
VLFVVIRHCCLSVCLSEIAIEKVPSFLLAATNDLRWENKVVYLYLVDEYTMQPVEGKYYPIEINTAVQSEFLKCVLPLMRVKYCPLFSFIFSHF